MQSVCKLPISIAILRLADAGKLSIQDKITVRRTDLVPFHSPIKEVIKGKQSDFTIRDLIKRSSLNIIQDVSASVVVHAADIVNSAGIGQTVAVMVAAIAAIGSSFIFTKGIRD